MRDKMLRQKPLNLDKNIERKIRSVKSVKVFFNEDRLMIFYNSQEENFSLLE